MGETYRICALPGDGIGPEVVGQSLRVLKRIGELHGVSFDVEPALIGGAAIDACGSPFPEESERTALACDAVLLGAVGGPAWDKGAIRPEQGLLALRAAMGAYCNLRPIAVYGSLASASPLKPEIVAGADLVIVRELTGGIYFGRRATEEGVEGAGPGGGPGASAYDTMEYSELEIERIARRAFEIARGRKGRVVSVDKANILDTSRLWRRVVHGLRDAEFPDIELSDMLVDNAAMQLVRDPLQFDVILTENTFGDILSDEAAMITGSLGMLASASLGTNTPVFEPIHGSAPDIAGKGIANPLAQILSAAMMLRHALGLPEAAHAVERAVRAVLDEGWRTSDLATHETDSSMVLGTEAMADEVIALL